VPAHTYFLFLLNTDTQTNQKNSSIMLLTFVTLAALLILVYGGSEHGTAIDPPVINPNSTIETFHFMRPLSWSNQDFDLLTDNNKTKVMTIKTKLKDRLFDYRFALYLTLLQSQEHLDIKINVSLQFSLSI
jgi:hypothetical protein